MHTHIHTVKIKVGKLTSFDDELLFGTEIGLFKRLLLLVVVLLTATAAIACCC
jgi:hypothetical protein